MYEIKTISKDDPRIDVEQTGISEKYWLKGKDGRREFLIKIPNPKRQDECWVEKVVCELCGIAGIPCAAYDLCECVSTTTGGAVTTQLGVITKNMCPQGWRLSLGNALMTACLGADEYISSMKKGKPNPTYTIENVMICLENLEKISKGTWIGEGARVRFCQYLALDAVVGNQDRHHQNWAILENENDGIHERMMAPTFDHGASLGRGLLDEERRARRATKDRNFKVAAYAERAKSMFTCTTPNGVVSRLSTLQALQRALELCPTAKKQVLEILDRLSVEQVTGIFDELPSSFITVDARLFAQDLIAANISRIRSHV